MVRSGLLLLSCVGLSGGVFISASQHHNQHHAGGDQVAIAGDLFKRRCANCHIPPDTRFKVDLAWLGQIKETT